MLTWGVAFRKAVSVILFTVGWYIVGGIIIFIGFSAIGFDTDAGAKLGILILFAIVGYLVIIFGSIATIIKILSESVAEAVEDRLGHYLRQRGGQ